MNSVWGFRFLRKTVHGWPFSCRFLMACLRRPRNSRASLLVFGSSLFSYADSWHFSGIKPQSITHESPYTVPPDGTVSKDLESSYPSIRRVISHGDGLKSWRCALQRNTICSQPGMWRNLALSEHGKGYKRDCSVLHWFLPPDYFANHCPKQTIFGFWNMKPGQC